MQIVLASSSSIRKQILSNYMEFTTISPNIDEKAIRHEDPKLLTLQIANAKMEAVQNKCPNSIVICLDQVILVNNKILEKPESIEEAKEFITNYNTYPAECISGLVIKNTKTNEKRECTVVAIQEFKGGLTSSIIDKIIKGKDCFWCAGALMIEHPLLQPFLIKNDYPEAIMGLPIKEVMQFIGELK